MKSIDVYILTGYLGAGKTTTLNKLLKAEIFSGKSLALIINEFGKMGVDGQLLVPGDYARYEINKGSIFCICTKTDFLKALDSIENQVDADAVIIEATGIAETVDIESILAHKHLEGKYEIRANICIVDAVNFTKTAPFLKAVTSQVRSADTIIINKTDLAGDGLVEQTAKVVKGINPDVGISYCSFGDFDTAILGEIVHIHRDRRIIEEPPTDVAAVSIKTGEIVNRDKFMEIIEQLAEQILRLKGNVWFNCGVRFVEVVGGTITEKEQCQSLSDKTAFTVIGWKMTGDELREAFQSITD